MSDSITAKVVSWWGGDRDIAHQAWASTFDIDRHEKRSEADVERVVRQVVEHCHGTPKERVWVDMHLLLPIFLERQYDKTRFSIQYQDLTVEFWEGAFGRWGISQNELSGRYRTIPTRYLSCPDDVSSILSKAVGDCEEYSPLTAAEDFDQEMERQANWYAAQMSMLKRAKAENRIAEWEYKRAREIMRCVLGTGFLTEMRMVLNLRALELLLEQRLDRAAQPEARELAMKIYYALVEADVAPVWREETMTRLGF